MTEGLEQILLKDIEVVERNKCKISFEDPKYQSVLIDLPDLGLHSGWISSVSAYKALDEDRGFGKSFRTSLYIGTTACCHSYLFDYCVSAGTDSQGKVFSGAYLNQLYMLDTNAQQVQVISRDKVLVNGYGCTSSGLRLIEGIGYDPGKVRHLAYEEAQQMDEIKPYINKHPYNEGFFAADCSGERITKDFDGPKEKPRW